MMDLDLFTVVAALGFTVILDCAMFGCPSIIDHLPCSVGPASWVAAALVLVPGFWLLSVTLQSLLWGWGWGWGCRPSPPS